MSADLPGLLEAVDKVGPTGALVIATIVFTWRVLPSMLRRWQVQSKQYQVVSDNIPRIEHHLARMAEEHGRLLSRIDTVTTGTEHKVTELLQLAKSGETQRGPHNPLGRAL